MKVHREIIVLLMLVIYLALAEAYKPIRQVPNYKAKQMKRSSSGHRPSANSGEICAEICSWWSGCTDYICEGGVCCSSTPDSVCCSFDKQLCVDDDTGCCPTGYPMVCGEHCCPSDGVCCQNVDNCCASDEDCCNSEDCCTEESPCCKQDGENEGTCCEQETMVCCGDSSGCANPCPSQFEAVPCDETTAAEKIPVDAENIICPKRLETRKLYRATYPGQSCYGGGLQSKDPEGTRTVSSHVGCGSGPGYKSQYISFSTSLDVVHTKYWPNALPGSRIVEIDLERIPVDCKTYDLTLAMNRAKWLGHNKWAMAYTINDCEVLLACASQIPCKTIEGPKGGENDDDLEPGKHEEL